MFTITIDGPSASGKSTVADIVAQKLNIHHLNSGEFYRAIALYMLRNKVDIGDNENIAKHLKDISIQVKFNGEHQELIMNGENVTPLLHSNEINENVSRFARNFDVVEKASELTYLATKEHKLIIDGRNVGSYVVKDAELKIYLDCDAKVRAERRMKEMLEKGEKVDFEEIYKQTLERDELDRTRKIAPLIVPENAHIIDSNNKTPEELAEIIVNLAKQ